MKIGSYNYFRNAEIIEITIRDMVGAKVDSFKWNSQDKERERNVFNIIRKKYGIFVKPEIEPRNDKDIEWLDRA